MDNTETQSSSSEQKNGINPFTVGGIVVLIAIVGWVLWLGSSKGAVKSADIQMTKTQKPTTASPSSTIQNVTVEGGNFYFKPNEIKVKKGQKVKVTFTNTGGTHDFVIDGLNVRTERIQGGASTTVAFTPDKTGIFAFYCSVGMHRQMGMKGNLIVE
ncbi:MAG TPA: cupredoxin domain-containing protein [Methylomirabilota bacterium]|nr:cupredoxin domain-containing protein [Methylomirabilota bacterium]